MSWPIQYTDKIRSMKAWIKLKREKGISVTSDDVWYKIGEKWPELDEATRTYIWERI